MIHLEKPMALITCPECNKSISDKAKACPCCGYPINERSAVLQQTQKYVNQCGVVAKEITNEFTSENVVICFSVIGSIVGVIAILTIIIMSVMGYHFVGMFGICLGIGVLIRKLNKNI
jgi:ribosomal protein L37E